MQHAIIVDAVISGNALAYECTLRGIKCIHLYSSIHSYQANFKSLSTNFFEIGLIYDSDETLLRTLGTLDIVLCVAGSDFGVALADHISNLLALPHMNVSNIKFDRYLIQSSLNEPCAESNFNAFLTMHKKCVTKPKISYGGYDRVSVVNEGDSVVDSAELYITPYYQGNEYSVDFVSCHGKHKIVSIWKYIKDGCNPFWRERTELIHYDENKTLVDSIHQYITSMLHTIGYLNGASHSEVILTSTGIKLVEVNFRTHGHMDYPGTAKALRRNHAQLTIDALLGIPLTDLGPRYETAAHITRVNFFNHRERPYNSIKWDEIRRLQSHSTSYLHYSPHQTIPVSEFNMRSIPAKIVFVNIDPMQLKRDTARALEIFNE